MYKSSTSINSIHAETNAIMNLPKLKRNKRLKKIDILVIRTSSTGKLGISKPCYSCLINMVNLPEKRGYIIKNILYSDENGDIIHTTLQNLLTKSDYHITRYYRNIFAKS
jgi:cytidine deaminase